MCNLYSMTKGQQAIRELTRAMHDRAGNLPPLPAIFPDQMAPVVREGEDGRELVTMRWGMPGPKQAGERPVTNIRNLASPHWRAWLKPQHRCLVPATSFCEYEDTQPRKTAVWFALGEDRPLFAFAGLWRRWWGARKASEEPAEHLVFSFLTCEPNAEVGAIHPKAMPVVLAEPEAMERWLSAPAEELGSLQVPLPDGSLSVVARGPRQDAAPAPA
ncbi:SOS response-associated peptidase [Alsobacter sp. R-9]